MADKKDKADGLVVVVPFAYPTTKAGEVKLLTKGDNIDPDLYTADSIDHLRSIGFIGSGD